MDISECLDKALYHKENGNFDSARKICLDILNKSSGNYEALRLLGLMYYEINEYELAVKYLTKALAIKSDELIIKPLAFSYYYMGKIPEAVKYLKICAEYEVSPEIYNKLISFLMLDELNYHKAYPYSEILYKKYPFDIENIVNFGLICLYTGKFNESITFCNKAFMINPKYSKVWILKGIIEEVLNFNDERARKCFKKALILGDKEAAYLNFCVNYSHSDYKKSNYYGRKLLQLKNIGAYNKVMYLMNTNYFAMRKMKRGYKYYVHRWDKTPDDDCLYVKIIKNSWQGGSHKDEKLFILSDLGYGDKIMYIRYLPFAAEKFKEVTVMCDDKLYMLFKRSYANLGNVNFIYEKNEPKYDKAVTGTYLPQALKMPDVSQIPFSDGYLRADKDKTKHFKSEYFNTDKLKAGLCWEAGSNEFRRLHNRSISFNYFKKMFTLNDKIQYYSFQLKTVSANESTLKLNNVIDLSRAISDFDDTAALLKNLDILITVDTSVAHLAGALGVNTFLILPYYAEWRWFDNIETTEWYNSVRIFKQTHKISYENEIRRIYNHLCNEQLMMN